MSLREEALTRLIYLWTRDAKMDVGSETEAYILGHLDAFSLEPTYSDGQRAEMARRLTKRYCAPK